MSAVKDMTPLGIKEEDLNLIRNDHIKFDCGPLVYRTIIQWGFALPVGKKIKDHINDLKIGEKINNRNFTRWLKDNETKLNKDSFSDFDITTLHDFLPILCYEKIAQTGGKEYEKQIKDPKSVESHLKEIKTFRNNVSHEYSEAVKDSHISKMKETMRECIRAAGKLYGKDKTEIIEKVRVLDDEFDEVLLNTTHFYENRVSYIAQKISSEVPANLLERYSPHFSVPLPGNWTKKDTSEIFQRSKLSVTTEHKEGKATDDISNKTVFTCNKIFNNKHDKFVVINGGPGSGKTTLMKNMCQNILQTSVHSTSPRYEKIEQFKIPIYLECKFEQQTNLPKFLRDCLRNFLSPEDDIYEAFKIVKGLVFLIDGYDEINNNCRKLVDSIIIFCRDYNASCIVSSRDDAGNNFVNELVEKNLNCTKISIEPISEMSERVNFLKSYSVKMDDSIDTDKLVKSFENLTAAAQEIFSSPILLALFISLFVHDPNSVSQLKNEQSAYEAVRTNFLREMARKLRNSCNPKGRAEDVAYVLSKFCLKLFRAKKYFLEDRDYFNLVTECEKIKGMPDDVNIPSLLSCILTPEDSFKFTLYTSYQFMHRTVQEFFAAKYVSENIKELQDNTSVHTHSEDRQLSKLLQVLGLDESQSDIKEEMERYGNIIKLLILEILANGGFSKYSNTFTQLLEKYFKPRFPTADYHLDLILSSDSNADIISIVCDCVRDWKVYNINYNRHIKPLTEVLQSLKTEVIWILFQCFEVANTYEILKLLEVLGYDSQIGLDLYHSYCKYQPLDGEFYTQLKHSKIRCKVIQFTACISSEEHLSIVERVFRGTSLSISTPSVSGISFAALKGHKGYLSVRVKYPNECPNTGSNPVRWGTSLIIEHIQADGKENVYNAIKYLCPKSKRLSRIQLLFCQLTDTDAIELLKQLHKEKIRTRCVERRTEVKELMSVMIVDTSRHLELEMVSEREEK